MKTPQILELSGIGDQAVLEPLGIQTKLHLPGVGANLQEHTWTSIGWGNLNSCFTIYCVAILILKMYRDGLNVYIPVS